MSNFFYYILFYFYVIPIHDVIYEKPIVRIFNMSTADMAVLGFPFLIKLRLACHVIREHVKNIGENSS